MSFFSIIYSLIFFVVLINFNNIVINIELSAAKHFIYLFINMSNIEYFSLLKDYISKLTQQLLKRLEYIFLLTPRLTLHETNYVFGSIINK